MTGGGAEALMFLLAALLVVWVLNRLFSRPPDG